MRKVLSKLFILLFAFVLIIPTFVFAENEDDMDDKEEAEEVTKEPMTVYLFRGEGCPHCAEAEEWFASIEEEYGAYFDLETYEVWYDENNSELMSYVADYMGESADGVPYIIIGEHSYSGFNSGDADTLIGYIMEEYNKDPADRIQIVPTVIEQTGWGQEEDTSTRDLIVGLVLVAIVVGIVVVIVKARKED